MNKLTRNIAATISAIMGVIFAFSATPAMAQINAGLSPIANTISLGTSDIRTLIARIIYVFLGVLGTILLVIILYAGFLWMTAGGDDDKITQAKTWIKNGVIGLIIILCSYAITYFVVTRLMGIRDSNPVGGPGSEQGITTSFGDYGDASLGEGIIQSHYPAPGATDVARNTKIIVTFKLPIDPATVIANGSMVAVPGRPSVYTGKINLASVRILASADVAAGGAFQTSADKLVGDVNAYSADNKTFVFAPVKYLGSPTDNVSYTVALGPTIMLADGKPAFSGNFAMGYKWEFATGTVVDTTPPHVVSIVPSRDVTVARNAVIEITFSEGVDPTSATGVYTKSTPDFSNVTVNASTDGRVDGTWEPSNQYRTIGFRTNVVGGTNSCGDTVYVLPGGQVLTVNALTATVGSAPPQAQYYPPDGIVDLAGNALDGDNNGTADGQPKDNVTWSFSTTNALDLTPPTVVSTDPSPESGNADLGKAIGIIFSKPMSITTLTNSNLWFSSLPKLPIWYFGEGVNLGVDGTPTASTNDRVVRTEAFIEHARLSPTVGVCSDGPRAGARCAVDTDCPGGGLCGKTTFSYYPKATSGVTDIYQNCFLPACGTDPSRRYCCPSASGDVSCRTECSINSSGGKLYCDETK